MSVTEPATPGLLGAGVLLLPTSLSVVLNLAGCFSGKLGKEETCAFDQCHEKRDDTSLTWQEIMFTITSSVSSYPMQAGDSVSIHTHFNVMS